MVIVLNYYELLGMATSKNLTVLEKQIAFISGRRVKVVIDKQLVCCATRALTCIYSVFVTNKTC